MTTITKERLQWLANISGRDDIDDIDGGEIRELALIALASLEAEPVAEIRAHYPLGINGGKQKFVQAIGDLPDFGGHLYAAPPAPVVPDEGRDQFEALIRFHVGDENHETLLLRANEGMNYRDPNVDFAWIFWKSSREHLLRNNDGSLPESGHQVRGLTLLVKRLASSLKSVNKSSNLPDKAMEYLKQNGLVGVEDVLR
ncbi:hypothetical protein [Escherichia coli]|uniref:hypothetical protein n=1 Tax=Escherichia coli TaxID=562 RepID=UPI0020A6C339|nr:hypothetical protein [Escherichia coli]